MSSVRPLAAAALFALLLTAPAAAQRVLVNGEPVSQEDFVRELGRYGIALTAQVPDGAYWYDRFSGLWGVEGGPTLGQMPAELALGGMLRPDASGSSGTAIFINGRELHYTEELYLQQLFGYTIPGRYWMNAMGIGGLEGGPPAFNLLAAAAAAQPPSGGGYTRRGLFGSMGSDGNCSYFMTPDGSSVMTGNC